MTKKAAETILKYSNGEVRIEADYQPNRDGIVVSDDVFFYCALADVMESANPEEKMNVANALRSLSCDNFGKGYVYF